MKCGSAGGSPTSKVQANRSKSEKHHPPEVTPVAIPRSPTRSSRALGHKGLSVVTSPRGPLSPRFPKELAHLNHLHVSTPSTVADSADCMEPPSPRDSRRTATLSSSASWSSPSGFRTSLQLASAGASPAYLQKAKELLQAGGPALEEACSGPSFEEALARQGLQLEELRVGSPLSAPRRAALLAAVLEEKDNLVGGLSPKAAPPAQAYRRQLERRLAESVERAKVHWEQRHTVALMQVELYEEREELNQQRQQEELEKAARARSREQALAEQRREEARIREESINAALARAEETLSSKTEDRRAHLEAKDDRSGRCLERRDERRQALKASLQRRFEMVLDTARRAHEAEEQKAAQQDEKLQEMMKRSDNHLEACRLSLELKTQQHQEKVLERQHQVLRVSRMKERQRFVRVSEIEEDEAIFAECGRLKVQMERELYELAAMQAMALPEQGPPALLDLSLSQASSPSDH